MYLYRDASFFKTRSITKNNINNHKIPSLTSHTAPAPPQSAAQEHLAHSLAHHYTPWPADAAQWTPPQEYRAWKTPPWYRHPSISPHPSSQWFCSHILPPHPCHGLSGLSFFQPHSTSSSGPGTC